MAAFKDGGSSSANSYGGLGAVSLLFGGISGIGSAYSQATAHQLQADYVRQMSEINNQIAGVQAEDAIMRGNKSASQFKKQVKGLRGSQRAALAAQGVEVDSGSAAEIQDNTDRQGALDVMTIQNNAWREAWGYKVAAIGNTAQANLSSISASQNIQSTILSGGLNAVSSGLGAYYYYKKG